MHISIAKQFCLILERIFCTTTFYIMPNATVTTRTDMQYPPEVAGSTCPEKTQKNGWTKGRTQQVGIEISKTGT